MPLKNKNTLLAEKVYIADNFYARGKGLLGRRSFFYGEAMLIKNCNCVHMFFMRFPIDVLFLDKHNRVVGIERGLRPWRISRIYWKASYVIELPAGVAAKTDTQIGDELSLG